MRILPSGSRTRSKSLHSWACRGLAASNETPGPGREDDVDDVLERHVVVVGPLVVAPADVHADAVRRHAGEGVVERLDVEARHPPELLEAQGGELDVPPHGEIRAVHLEQEPRADHRLVLVPHGVRNGEEVGLVARVVVVPEEEGDDPRRGRRQEGPARRRRVVDTKPLLGRSPRGGRSSAMVAGDSAR